MEHPLKNIRVFKLTALTRSYVITTKYSKSGLTVHAWKGFSDNPIARATGGGYDKTHTALLNAVKKILDRDIDANGSAGFDAVEEGVQKLGKGYSLEQII